MPSLALMLVMGAPPLPGAALFVAVFWAVALALGRRLSRWLRLTDAGLTVWERGLVAVTLGAGTLQLFPYLLAVFGVMTPAVVRWGFAGLGLLLMPDLIRVVRRARGAVAALPLRSISRAGLLWGALFGGLMVLLLLRASFVGNFGDDDGYHLSAPKRWLQAGTLSYLPTYMATNASMGFEMLYTIALAAWSPVAAKLLHFSAGLFTFGALVLAARRFTDPRVGLVAISLLLIATPFCDVPMLLRMAYVDLAAAWMVAASVLLWLRWREAPQPGLLLGMALCAGFAGSFKTTALAVSIAWLPVLVQGARAHGFSRRNVALTALRFGAVSVAPVLPWLLRNWRLTGNPLYPMLSGLIPTRDWTPEHARIFGRYAHYYAWGLASGASLGETTRQLLVLVTAALVAVAGGLASARAREPVARGLFLFSTVFTLISLFLTGLIFRYWLPAMICAGLALSAAILRRQSGPALLRVGIVAVAIALGLQLRREAKEGEFLARLRVAVGAARVEEAYADDRFRQLWNHINVATPPDARILMAAFYTTFGASTFGAFAVDRTCYATDSHLQAFLRLDEWPAFLRSVQEAGIDHVVVADRETNAGRVGFSFPAVDHEFAYSKRLVQEFGEPVGPAFANLRLYRLDTGRLLATSQSLLRTRTDRR